MEDLKRQAGERAAELVTDGMKVGLGTGSTVHYTLLALGRRVREEGLDIVGVPTSARTERTSNEVGIPLGELKERVLKEEAEKGGTPTLKPPSRWHPHRVFAGPAAAHDQINEMVDDIALRVYQYMQFNEMVDETGAVVARPKDA